jgi:predicted Holliday junction resolvase-like endonuclease
MGNSSKAVIHEFRHNKKFRGTCPDCGHTFRLADIVMYSLADSPPQEAAEAIRNLRAHLRERRDQLSRLRERMTTRAQTTAAAVNLGKIVEKILPSFSSFAHPAGDCRALFEPIDYIVFSGLAKHRLVDKLLFIDVKSGGARLTKDQRNIKQVVESGDVAFRTTDS